jgi:hypothetical protein
LLFDGDEGFEKDGPAWMRVKEKGYLKCHGGGSWRGMGSLGVHSDGWEQYSEQSSSSLALTTSLVDKQASK